MKLDFFAHFSSHCDQRDLLRWHACSGSKFRTCIVHGEVAGAQELCPALPQRRLQVEVARIDLARAA